MRTIKDLMIPQEPKDTRQTFCSFKEEDHYEAMKYDFEEKEKM